jgi:hypothetical protein
MINDKTEMKNEQIEGSSDQEEESFEDDSANEEEDINNSILSEALRQTNNKLA